MKKFEYKYQTVDVTMTPYDFTRMLNLEGEYGWELVGPPTTVIFFKREIIQAKSVGFVGGHGGTRF